MRRLALASVFALATAATAVAAPVDQPYLGRRPVTDFPAPVWAEARGTPLWLDARRERSTYPPCQAVYPGPTDQCGYEVPLPGSFFNPFTQTRAGLRVAVGDVVRFHLPTPPAQRPVLDTGVTLGPTQTIRSGARFTLGTTDAPWIRIKKTTRSGLASLTTATGTYWFTLSIRR